MTGLLQHPAVQRHRPGGDLPQGLRPSARARRNKILARVLWTVVGILFVAFSIRGISDWFRPPIAPAVAAVPVAAAGGDSQRFAAAFAYTLLTYSPERAEQQQADLAGMLTKNLNAQDAIAPSSRPQRVVAAWPGRPTPTRSVPGDPRGSFRSIVVVTCVVARRGHTTTMNLSVPIFDDGADGLAVTGYPAVVPLSLAANVAPKPQQPLADSESHAIGSFLNRFFDQYLAAAVIPELLTPAAVRHQRVPPLGQPFTLVGVEDVQQLLGTSTAKWLAVRLVARDTKTRATFTLSYWLRVIYRDGHWLVDDLKR